jgi:hypothetical protein
MAELDLLEQLGKLVSVDEMRQVTGRRYRAIRDKLLNIPTASAPSWRRRRNRSACTPR